MSRAVKIAISLPEEIMREMERQRELTGETRSGLVRRALKLLFEAGEHRAKVEAYIDGYRRDPESSEDLELAAVATEILSREPW